MASGKNQAYVKDRVFKYRKEWWNKWKEMLNSGEKDLEKIALIEYNKLQQKVLPTQLEGSDGANVTVNILGMGIEQPKKKPIDGEVV